MIELQKLNTKEMYYELLKGYNKSMLKIYRTHSWILTLAATSGMYIALFALINFDIIKTNSLILLFIGDVGSFIPSENIESSGLGAMISNILAFIILVLMTTWHLLFFQYPEKGIRYNIYTVIGLYALRMIALWFQLPGDQPLLEDLAREQDINWMIGMLGIAFAPLILVYGLVVILITRMYSKSLKLIKA